VSLERFWLLPLGISAVMALAAARPWRRPGRLPDAFDLGSWLLASVTGVALMWAQLPPPSATRPLDTPLAALEPAAGRMRSSASEGIILA
jgi:hypothetical protein